MKASHCMLAGALTTAVFLGAPFAGCAQSSTTPVPADAALFALSADGGFARAPDGATPTGVVYALTVTATGLSSVDGSRAPAEGLTLAFASGATAVAFSPATVTTNASGQATSYVTVPYGTRIDAIVSGGGAATSASTLVPTVALNVGQGLVRGVADAGLVGPDAGAVDGSLVVPTGDVYGLTVTATAWADGGPPVSGLPLAFATTSNGTSAVAFAPATVNTNVEGKATSYVTLPYGTNVEAVVSGGGAIVTTASASSPLKLTLTTALARTGDGGFPTTNDTGVATFLPNGALYAATVVATTAGVNGAGPVPVAGATISFATTTTGTGAVTFSPGSLATGPSGTATSYATIPYGASVEVIASSGAALAEQFVVAPAMTLTPSLRLASASGTGAECVAAEPCELLVTANVAGTAVDGLAVTPVVREEPAGAMGPIDADVPIPPLITVDGGASYTFTAASNAAGYSVVVTGGEATASSSFPVE